MAAASYIVVNAPSAGTAGSPAYSFGPNNNYGTYYDSGNNAVGVSNNGIEVAYFTGNALVLPNSGETIQAAADIYANTQGGNNIGIRFGANNITAMALQYFNNNAYYVRNQYTGNTTSFIMNGAYTAAKTAAYTITQYDSGTTFCTVGATGAVPFTLPASPTAGLLYYFEMSVAQTVTILGNGNSILGPGLTGTTRTCTQQGASAMVKYDGANWIISPWGTWT